jgi:hypothetical protein
VLDAAVASDTVKITVRVNRPLRVSQGDQIGRTFAHRAIAGFEQFIGKSTIIRLLWIALAYIQLWLSELARSLAQPKNAVVNPPPPTKKRKRFSIASSRQVQSYKLCLLNRRASAFSCLKSYGCGKSSIKRIEHKIVQQF